MIMKTLVFFGVLLASIYLGIWLQQDPGYIFVSIHQWTIEATFWVGMIALILFITLIHLLLGLLKRLRQVPRSWQQWRTQHRIAAAAAKTKRGLIEFCEGHWQAAKKILIAAAPNSTMPLINYLTAAKAAEELGEPTLRDHYLTLAQEADPNAVIAIELTQAQLQIDHQQWQQAEKTLEQLQTLSPNHPLVIKLFMQIYQSTQNWPALIQLLPKIKSYNILSHDSLHQLTLDAYSQQLQQLIHDQHKHGIEEFFCNLPKALKQDPDILAVYTRYLLDTQQNKTAESILRHSLKIQPHTKLIAVYGQIDHEHAQIPFVESLLRQDQGSAVLHLCIGQLYKAQKIWGSAKEHLERSIDLNATPEAYYELGLLLENLDDQPAACQAYRKGLTFFIRSPHPCSDRK